MPKGKKRSRSKSREETGTRNVRMKPLTLKIEEAGFDDPSINLKDICCRIIEQTLFPNIQFGGRLDVIHNYLDKVRKKNHLIGENMVPSQTEIKQDLIKAFNELKKSRGRLVGTPALSDEELTTLYLTPQQAKLDQIKKDDWLNRLVENSAVKSVTEKNRKLEEWLTEMEMDDKPPPITPIPRDVQRLGDEWKDLSNIYADCIYRLKGAEEKGGVTELTKNFPDNIPKTYICINVGKLTDYHSKLEELGNATLEKVEDIIEILFKFTIQFVRIGIKFFGTFIYISAEFVANLFINIIKDKTNNKFRELFFKVIEGTIGAPFVITCNRGDIQKEIFHKYRLFLTGIVMKTLFMLGNIGYGWSLPSLQANIREIFNIGIERLNLYNRGELTKVPRGALDAGVSDLRLHKRNDRERANRIMDYMNKYTEWYLKRKTTIFLNTDSKGLVGDPARPRVLLLEDRKPVRQMTMDQIASAQGFGPFGAQSSVPGPGNDLDSDRNVQMAVDEGSRGEKKKNTKKRKRKSYTKKRKRKSNTKKHKKIKKKTKIKK